MAAVFGGWFLTDAQGSAKQARRDPRVGGGVVEGGPTRAWRLIAGRMLSIVARSAVPGTYAFLGVDEQPQVLRTGRT
jgi:hypothetical protein